MGIPKMKTRIAMLATAMVIGAMSPLHLIASNEARAEDVLLSCWGTVELIQQGRQVNPVDEKSSIAIAVDIAKKIW
jgi:hypothetical protein